MHTQNNRSEQDDACRAHTTAVVWPHQDDARALAEARTADIVQHKHSHVYEYKQTNCTTHAARCTHTNRQRSNRLPRLRFLLSRSAAVVAVLSLIVSISPGCGKSLDDEQRATIHNTPSQIVVSESAKHVVPNAKRIFSERSVVNNNVKPAESPANELVPIVVGQSQTHINDNKQQQSASSSETASPSTTESTLVTFISPARFTSTHDETTTTKTTLTPDNDDDVDATSRQATLRRETSRETTTPAATSTSLQPDDSAATEREHEDDARVECDDDDAEGCEGVSDGEPAKAKNLTDNERLVNLQSYLQRKVKKKLAQSMRSGMEMFEQLSLTGSCSSSLTSLMMSATGLKAFAFKFIDASAKIPSGLMFGLLSDFGDYDQCVSIRSRPDVAPEDEPDEPGAYSGKYCLASVRLNIHVKLQPNETVPEGIVPDGVLWDELVRNYWTSESTKGFQAGVCLPSRCTDDDIEQLFKHVIDSYNLRGELAGCQTALDVKRSHEPDVVQWIILCAFNALLLLIAVGTLIDRHRVHLWLTDEDVEKQQSCMQCTSSKLRLVLQFLICFSLARSWRAFLDKDNMHWLLMHRHRNQMHRHRRHHMSSVAESDLTSKLGGADDVCQQATAYLLTSASSSSPPRGLRKQASMLTTQSVLSRENSAAANVANLADTAETPVPPRTLQFINRAATQASLDIKSTLDLLEPGSPMLSTPSRDSNSAFAGSSNSRNFSLAHLSGLRLFVIIWITMGQSFLYPSAHNYQYYRAIINMNITRDSLWFALTNFPLGIDMLLYMSGLLFVLKLAAIRVLEAGSNDVRGDKLHNRLMLHLETTLRLVARKILRFWPTYVCLICAAIVAPTLNDGPMWPEMVGRRLGDACRRNWWSNLLFINNYMPEANICLPSSWYVSVLMQVLLVGCILALIARSVSKLLGAILLAILIVASSVGSSFIAYTNKIPAPVIRLDESFVMEMDAQVFSLFTATVSNLGPFLVGMIGGMLLLRAQRNAAQSISRAQSPVMSNKSDMNKNASTSYAELFGSCVLPFMSFLCAMLIGACVLGSAFRLHYSAIDACLYWGAHRIAWSIFTGYIIHNCATGRLQLMADVLSLSSFKPLSKLIFVSFLVFPMLTQMHTGTVRDGLHVSSYNMLIIYVSRLVLTFASALCVHLLVEQPSRALEALWIERRSKCERSPTGSH